MKYLLVSIAIVIALSAWVRPAQASFLVNAPRALGLNNGLVSWWTFDGKDISGVQAYDRSGNGNRGILTNGPVPAMGKLGQGMGFDGVDDRVQLPSSFDSFSSWTFAHWVRSPAAPTGDNAKQTFQNREAFGFSWDHTNATFRQAVFIRDSGTNYTAAKLTSTLQPNTWYFIAGTWDGVTVRAYLNGIQEASATEGDTIDPGSGTGNIGAGQSNTINFTGLIDDVRIYNRALSADEIKRLYNIGGTVKLNSTATSLINGLVGWWTFDGKDVSGVQAYDRSGNGNRGILTGSVNRVSGKIGQSMEFDGTDGGSGDWVNVPDPANNSLDPTSEYSLSVWVKYTVTSNYGFIISKTNLGLSGYELFRDSGSGKIRFSSCDAVGNCGGGYFDIATNASYNDGKWHHIIATAKTNQTARIYIDGQLVQSSGTITQDNLQTSVDFRIGSRGRTDGTISSLPFNGLIDDVRIYNRALSANEIKRLYNMGR